MTPADKVARTKVAENVPMQLSLADSKTTIGWGTLWREDETGFMNLDIRLMQEGTEMMDHLLEICEITAIGFVGVMKQPERPKHARR